MKAKIDAKAHPKMNGPSSKPCESGMITSPISAVMSEPTAFGGAPPQLQRGFSACLKGLYLPFAIRISGANGGNVSAGAPLVDASTLDQDLACDRVG